MAQFYTKERSIQGASPKIYDDSQRILTEAEQIIESMRALSSIEERQNAALINNLRAHRQREKELNTRNHQMLMDNMRQVQEVQERNDRVDLANKQLKSRQEAEQERRTMETLATLSKTAGQLAGAMVEDGLAQETKRAQEEATRLQEINPQQFDAERMALDGQLATDAAAGIASEATAFLAKTSGKDMNFVARMFVSPERLQRMRREVLAGEFAARVERGSLEDYIRQNPNETVTITQNGQDVVIPLSQVASGQVGSSEDLNRIYTEVANKLMKPIKGDADPLIYQKADERIRNYINTRTLQYSDKLTRDNINETENVKLQQLLLAESPDDMATNAVVFVDQAGVSPYKDRGAALNQITNQILPNTPNPVAFAEAIGEREFRHMPGTKIKDTPFGKTLKREALRFERAQEADLLNQSKAQGSQIGDRIFQASFGDDQLFDAAEYQAGYNAVREKEANGTINFETARQAELKLDSYYQSYSDSTLTKQLIADLSERQELTKPFLDSAFASGQINRSTYDTELSKIQALSTVKLPNGMQYSVKSIRAQALQIASAAVTIDAVSGQPKSFTAYAAADLAADLYVQKFQEYAVEFTPEVAAKKAWTDVQGEMLNREGQFFVEKKAGPNGEGIYSRLSVGNHTGSIKMPKAPTLPATEVGTQLLGEGAIRLDDKEFTSVDTNIAAYAAQIRNGNQIKPTAYDQEVADAAGIPLHELLNRRFKALGIEGVEAKEGSFGIIRKASEISPELQRVLNSPKTWNKLSSVTDRSPNLMPARMGTQAMGFHNASSIARKFGHPNPELIAGIWASETNEGRNPSKGTPAQQIKEIIENNPDLNMFIPYSELASQLPAVVPYMRKYGDSHTGISGTSKTIARMQSSLVGQPSRLSEAIIGKESGGQSGVTNKDSGALGYGQVMPENVPSWTKEALGRSMTPEEFLNDPQAQIRVVNFKIKQYYDTAIRQGHPPDIAIRMAAAAWYAGPGNMHLYDNNRPQYTNGNRYPSIAEYTKDILRRYKNE